MYISMLAPEFELIVGNMLKTISWSRVPGFKEYVSCLVEAECRFLLFAHHQEIPPTRFLELAFSGL